MTIKKIILSKKNMYAILSKEISQKMNFNAYSRLFISSDNRFVYKIYTSNFDSAKQNISIVEKLNQKTDYCKIEGLVFPEALIIFKHEVVGFGMPFIVGKTLEERLLDQDIAFHQKINWFIQIYEIIDRMNQLPFSFHIGDLYSQNVLIDGNEKVWLIDIDSFSIDNLHGSTPPYMRDNYEKFIYSCKKYIFNEKGSCSPSYDTDIYCLSMILMDFISGGYKKFSELSLLEIDEYLFFLSKQGLSKDFLDMIANLYKEDDNYFSPEYLLTLLNCSNSLDYQSYIDFRYSEYTKSDIQEAERIIEEIYWRINHE